MQFQLHIQISMLILQAYYLIAQDIRNWNT